MKFTCQLTPNGLQLHASPQQGTYPGWWKNIRIEIYGWKPSAHTALLNGKALQSSASPIDHGVAITIPSSAEGFELSLK
jgi:alpha-glucosidase